MLELKPCPFCGGEAEAYDYEYGIDPVVAYGCKCERCGIAMSGYDSKCEAIEAWNTRHEWTCRNIHPDVFQCSECYAIDEDWKHPPFCHGCGAKVVG